MKTWHIVAIAVGSVAAIAIVAKVASSGTQREAQFSGPIPGGAAGTTTVTGDAGERAVTGGFSIASRLIDVIGDKVARDDAARERQRERDAERERDDRDSVTDPIVKSRLLGRG